MFLLNIYIPFVAQYNFCAKFCIKTSLNISNLNVIFCQCFLSSFTQFRPPPPPPPPHPPTHTQKAVQSRSHADLMNVMYSLKNMHSLVGQVPSYLPTYSFTWTQHTHTPPMSVQGINNSFTQQLDSHPHPWLTFVSASVFFKYIYLFFLSIPVSLFIFQSLV